MKRRHYNQQLVQLAARANANWCHAVCQVHDAPGQFDEDVWYSSYPVPSYYPNTVTLRAAVSLEKIQLVTGQLPGPASVKDSFHNLNLVALGFTRLFDAQWLLAPEPPASALPFQFVENARQLRAWETAWSDGQREGFFHTKLLDNPATRIIAVYLNDHLVAGAIAYKDEQAISLSNVFCRIDGPTAYWLTCVRAALTLGADLPVFAYEREATLAFTTSIGFMPLGPLCVWIRQ